MRWGVRVVACVCVGSLAVVAVPAQAAFPGKNGRIAFQSDRSGGDSDIWTMNSDGTAAVNLTESSTGGDEAPNWRADGKVLAFMSDRVTPTNPTGDFEIFTMAADGSGQRQVTANEVDDEDPAWSPDGSFLAFQRDLNPVRGEIDYDLIVTRSDGTRERNLTRSAGTHDVSPNWSPEGRRLVFGSTRDGDDEIYTMRPDGTRVRQLTFNEDRFDGHPTWSPDGRRIGFERERRGGPPDLFTMRADGRRQKRIVSSDAFDVFMAWSPDGRRIAFNSDRDGDPEVFLARSDGRRQDNWTNHDAADLFPDWQPVRGDDGQRVRRRHLRTARAATARYRDIDLAHAAGYRVFPDAQGITCIAKPGSGAMGIHHANPELFGDPALVVGRPEVLVYEPLPSGRLRLVALEYVVLREPWDAAHDGPPKLFGREFTLVRAGNRYGLPDHYELHVWLWKHNPNGTFADWNPRVRCPGSMEAAR